MRPYDDERDEIWYAFVKFGIAVGIVATIFMLGVIFAPPASSGNVVPCLPRAELIKKLPENYGEKPLWLGIKSVSNGKASTEIYFEVWGGPNGWSLVTGVQGSEQVCFVAVGNDWALMPQALPSSVQPLEEEH